MTLLEKINSLTWYDLINKLKDILKGLNDKPSGGDSRPYKVYTALLTQSGTDAPVATVLENTIGNITFEGIDLANGIFNIKSNGLFLNEKTAFFLAPCIGVDYTISYVDENTIVVNSDSQDNLQKSPIEIRVYN